MSCFLFKKGCISAGWAQRGRIQEEEGELGAQGTITGDVHEKGWGPVYAGSRGLSGDTGCSQVTEGAGYSKPPLGWWDAGRATGWHSPPVIPMTRSVAMGKRAVTLGT